MSQRYWTDDEIATIRRLWGESYSASAIALNLEGRSRGSVIGKLDRLGLMSDTGRPRAKRKPFIRLSSKPGGKIATGKRHIRGWRKRNPKPPTLPKAPPLAPVLPASDPILFHTRRMGGQCAFIAGDPKHSRAEDIQCCGAVAFKGSPWCQFHHEIVYLPPQKRDRRSDRLVWRTA